ncbi:aldo-keto reductase 2 [Scenedesmus sp. PABB004]|nr:aldo-keto reductase 2 [Scenedesmus sp. PABB004]
MGRLLGAAEQPLPGVPLLPPAQPQRAGEVLLGYEVELAGGCRLTPFGWACFAALLAAAAPLSWLPFVCADCRQRVQRPGVAVAAPSILVMDASLAPAGAGEAPPGGGDQAGGGGDDAAAAALAAAWRALPAAAAGAPARVPESPPRSPLPCSASPPPMSIFVPPSAVPACGFTPDNPFPCRYGSPLLKGASPAASPRGAPGRQGGGAFGGGGPPEQQLAPSGRAARGALRSDWSAWEAAAGAAPGAPPHAPAGPEEPGAGDPPSAHDWGVVEAVLRAAEAAARADHAAGRGDGGGAVTLPRLLAAYEAVLPAHGVAPAEDVAVYRLLLQLSLDPRPDWHAKLAAARRGGGGGGGAGARGSPRARAPRRSPGRSPGGRRRSRPRAARALGEPAAGRLRLRRRRAPGDAWRQRSRSASPPGARAGGRAGSADGSFCAAAWSSPVCEVARPASPERAAAVAAAAAGAGFQPPAAAASAEHCFSPGLWPAARSTDALAAAAAAAERAPVAARPGSAWRGEAAASHLSGLALAQYVDFARRMAKQQGWARQLAGAAGEPRDALAAAEHRWRLAMSFWEVHAAWRCFACWRRHAADAAVSRGAGDQRWLLLHAFSWWQSMARHYRQARAAVQLQQQQQPPPRAGADGAGGAPAAAAPPPPPPERPCSPLAGIARLLAAQPQLRAPTSAAAALRAHPSGRLVAGYALAAWRGLVASRRDAAHTQSLLTWHHVQHVQAGAWSKWRLAFEAASPHHGLMRVVYRSRRHAALRRVSAAPQSAAPAARRTPERRRARADGPAVAPPPPPQALRHWRLWAPAKRASRRRLRDAQAALGARERRRVWRVLRDYAAKRRAVNGAKRVAAQHFRRACLTKHLAHWGHALDIRAALEQLSDGAWERALARRGGAALAWWRRWVGLRQAREDLELHALEHMAGFTLGRCFGAWRGLVCRRAELAELEERCRRLSLLAAGRAALRAWQQLVALRRRHQAAMLAIATAVLRRQLSTAWAAWRGYVLRRREQRAQLAELAAHDRARVWQQGVDAWCAALHSKVKLVQAAATIQHSLLRRCVRHWKARVDQRADWRVFEAGAAQHMARRRAAGVLRAWASVAARRGELRRLLAGLLQARRGRVLAVHFSAWHGFLAQRVARRMNALSALLLWEQGLTRRALAAWTARAQAWRWKRERLLRADTYSGLRLLDLALTTWASVWTEAQELRQRAALFALGRQAELQVAVLRGWREQAARLRVKRERLEIAGLHAALTRQQQVLAAWRAEAARRARLRGLVTASLQRWSQLTAARAFEQWRSWALHHAGLQRRARAVMSLLAGRSQAWAFCKLREHALRKRHTRSARHFAAAQLAAAVLGSWRRVADEGRGFRAVLDGVGAALRAGCSRRRLAAGATALMAWGGNRKRLCFQTWRQWTALKQGRRGSLHAALLHRQRAYLAHAFSAWQEHAARAQALRGAWDAWRAFVPGRRAARRHLSRALLFWQRRLLAVALFTWQDAAAGAARRRRGVAMAAAHATRARRRAAFCGWRRAAQVAAYRRHVIAVVGARQSNGTLLKAFNAWKDAVDAKQARRVALAAAHARWARRARAGAFSRWHALARDAGVARRVEAHWTRHVLAAALTGWREATLVAQRRGIAAALVSGKARRRLLTAAWTAWQEVVDQRRQAAGRLRGVAVRLARDELARCWDAWREAALLRQMARMAGATWRRGAAARCFGAWHARAAARRRGAAAVSAARAVAGRRLAADVLHAWAGAAWALPRQRDADALARRVLQRRALRGWAGWLDQRRRWARLDAAVGARWANLHVSSAWRAWRAFVAERRRKADLVATVSRGWTHLHLAAAFRGWREVVDGARHRAAALTTLAGRWRNLHAAAAFGAWRSFVAARRRRRAAGAAVAARWTNLHVAAAFAAWRVAVAEAAERAAAAEGAVRRRERAALCAAFAGWRATAGARAALRGKAHQVEGAWGRLGARAALAHWRGVVAWRGAKAAADARWRAAVLRALLGLWRRHAQREAGHAQRVQLQHVRTGAQLLRRSLSAWQSHVQRRRQAAVADAYACARRQQRAFLAWAGLACAARHKATAAVDMAARAAARLHNRLLAEAFAGWRAAATRSAALRAALLRFATRRLRACLLAWRERARQLAGAGHLLRTLLATTLRGAFSEWRITAREQAHWRRVRGAGARRAAAPRRPPALAARAHPRRAAAPTRRAQTEDRLLQRIQTPDGERAALLAARALRRWAAAPLGAALDGWRAAAAERVAERAAEHRAATFLYYALTLKALTALKWAVGERRAADAARRHARGGAARRALRAWRRGAAMRQEKRRKLVAAVFTYSNGLTARALAAWMAYAQHRLRSAAHSDAAARHWAARRGRRCIAAWAGVVGYLSPLRRNLGRLQGKRLQGRTRQAFAAWRAQARRGQLLQGALAARAQRVLAGAFDGWRGAALARGRRRGLLQAAVTRLGNLLLCRAFARWREATERRQALRARAREVLARTLRRQLAGALRQWRAYAAHRSRKWELLAFALSHRRAALARAALSALASNVSRARGAAAAAASALKRRQARQRASALRWWHLLAQDMHHHRVVLASFRARALRRDGGAVLGAWREWARERTQERRAMVARWNRLLVTAFGAWVAAREDARDARADAHRGARLAARALAAWRRGMALAHRKRALSRAAGALRARHACCAALRGWMVATYYRHMAHVALHFRVRRLGCLALRGWMQAAQERAAWRGAGLELTHELATRRAGGLLAGWSATTAAQRHWRGLLLRGCLRRWAAWAPGHRARNAAWRTAAATLQRRQLERAFYCWRWYCQVRVLRGAAFHAKQRAIAEALAIGEQVARRRRRELLTASFMAWHVQVSKYRKVAQRLAGLLAHSLATCFRAWRAAADQARVDRLRAERHWAGAALRRLLPAWADAAADGARAREAAEAAADRRRRRALARAALAGWREELACLREQRGALWRVLLAALARERAALLGDALRGWAAAAAARVAPRARVAGFVNRRRLACLSDFLDLWRSYAAAMRTDGAALLSAAASLAGTPAGPGGWPDAARLPCSPGPPALRRRLDFEPAHAPDVDALPRGLLPVSGGPGSPLLGPRSAHQDRTLARRMAALGGGAGEVDPGSESDEAGLFAGLPPSAAAAAAAERGERQAPLLALSRGFQGRRVTLGDDRASYDDAAGGAGGRLSPRGVDLRAVADSVRQAHELGLPPWQLPSVRTSPPPRAPHPTSLSLAELRDWAAAYLYSLRQRGQDSPAQGEPTRASWAGGGPPRAPVVGRPGSAGTGGADYEPLLQRQLELQQQQLELRVWEVEQARLQLRLGSPAAPRPPSAPPGGCAAPQPWHDSGAPPRGGTHWGERRAGLLARAEHGGGGGGSGGTSRSGSPSSSGASATAGSAAGCEAARGAEEERRLQQRLYGKWWPAAAGQSPRRQPPQAGASVGAPPGTALPSFGGETLPRSLAALVTPCARAQQRGERQRRRRGAGDAAGRGLGPRRARGAAGHGAPVERGRRRARRPRMLTARRPSSGDTGCARIHATTAAWPLCAAHSSQLLRHHGQPPARSQRSASSCDAAAMALPQRTLGGVLTGSCIGLGCMSLTQGFYGGAAAAPSEEEAVAVIRGTLSLGVNVFDTSDLYGPYINEELLGRALSGVPRHSYVLCTKWGPMFTPDGGVSHTQTRAYARAACEASLRRLGTDYVDLFTLRGPVQPGVDIGEVMLELKALVAEGKVRGVGLSEVGPDQIRAAAAVVPIAAIEQEYSLFVRDLEDDLLPVCRELGIGVLAYSPLGRGLLTGKLKDTAGLEAGDFRVHSPWFTGDNLSKNLALVANLERLAAAKGVMPSQLALAWLLAKAPDVIPIPGTRRLAAVAENAAAAAITLTADELAELEAAVPAGGVAGQRYAAMDHLTYKANMA